MCRFNKLTVRVRPSALLVPALFLLLTDTPALLAALLLAALLHELAHYAMLRLFGIRAACFTLTGLGASLYVPELHCLSYGAELLSAAAGPLMNLLLWVLAYVLIMAVHPFLEIVLLGMFLYSFTNFLSISACYPLVNKYLVKPIEEMQAQERAAQAEHTAGEDGENSDDTPAEPDDSEKTDEKPYEKPAIRDTDLF